MVVNGDKPGLGAALPAFSRLGPLRRTPEEGANTILWLATDRPRRDPTTTPGPGEADPADGVWHDRRPRREYFLSTTGRGPEQRDRDGDRLWAWCADRTGHGFAQADPADRRCRRAGRRQSQTLPTPRRVPCRSR
jgi:dehydrogenase/reductase SDR family member 12